MKKKLLLLCLWAMAALAFASAQTRPEKPLTTMTTEKDLNLKGNPGVANAKLKPAIDKTWILDVELPNIEPRVLLISKVEKNAPITLAIASANGKARIDDGSGSFVEKEVSKDTKNPTRITITAGADAPRVFVEGAITMLDCSNSFVKSMDCSQARELKALRCNGNELEQLDVSPCANLEMLHCTHNAISVLNIGALAHLQELICNNNQINFLDLVALPSLKSLSCDKNRLRALDLSSNPLMEMLYCKRNRIEKVDLTKIPVLRDLSCEGNNIKSLDFSANKKLEKLYCGDNLLEELNVKGLANLTEINCKLNKLTHLDLKEATKLSELYCFDNKISSLDLSMNKDLNVLSCGANQLTELNLGGLSALSSLSCSFNRISQITLTGCTALEAAALDHNSLEKVDLAGCKSIKTLFVHNNKIKAEASESLVKSLPEILSEEKGILVFFNKAEYPEDEENNELKDEAIRIANTRGWVVANGETPIDVSYTPIDLPQTVAVHPNVANSHAFVVGKYVSYHLFDARGDLILSNAIDPCIEAAQYPEGMYFVSILLPDGSRQTERLVIRH